MTVTIHCPVPSASFPTHSLWYNIPSRASVCWLAASEEVCMRFTTGCADYPSFGIKPVKWRLLGGVFFLPFPSGSELAINFGLATHLCMHVKLRVFEIILLRRTFGPRRDEVTGEWRRLHNDERNDLYSSPNIVRVIKSRRMRWAGHVARMGEERGVYMVLVGKPEGRRPLGRPRHRWVDNIRMDLKEMTCGYMDWIGLAQDRRTLVSAVMNLGVPWNAGNFLTSWNPVSFSRRTLHRGESK